VREVRVALDLFGSDGHPEVEIEAIERALARDPALHVVAFGSLDASRALTVHERLVVQDAPYGVPMDAAPSYAVRNLADSAMSRGLAALGRGEVDAFVSAGNTGAVLAFSLRHVRRIAGIPRPAIAVILPSKNRETVLLDAGANAECKAEFLLGFARIGSALARAVLDTDKPTVGLVNIGEEETKGDSLRKEAFALLAANVERFVGNVEPTHLLDGRVSVLVTDGFSGNLMLKTLEGAVATMTGIIKEALTRNVAGKVAGLLARSSLKRELSRFDYEKYGGSLLAGLDKPVVIAHGRSTPQALANALLFAARVARADMASLIQGQLAGTGAEGEVAASQPTDESQAGDARRTKRAQGRETAEPGRLF